MSKAQIAIFTLPTEKTPPINNFIYIQNNFISHVITALYRDNSSITTRHKIQHHKNYRISSNTSLTAFVQKQAGSLNRSRGLTANTIELMVLVHTTVVRCIIRDILLYLWHPLYVIMASGSSKKQKKSYTLNKN